MMYVLTNAKIYTGEQELTDRAILIDRHTIVDLLPQQAIPEQATVIDLHQQSIAPGFIDLQLNGCGGVMFNDTIDEATLNIMHQTNLKSGTTSFLPTLITTSDQKMKTALEVVQTYQKQHSDNILGLHLEGPYLNPKRRGIHNEVYVRPPDRAMLKHLTEYGHQTLKLITLAPEMVSPKDIRDLTEAGIIVAAGHTDATYDQAIEGFNAGIQMVTHLFNAMSPWLGRTPGLVGATLDRQDVYAGIIADGHHVHFASIRLVQRLKRDKLMLVTDATPPAGTEVHPTMDSFQIGGQQVFYRDGKCVSAEGTLGGSALTMITAIQHCVQQVGIPLAEALRMAATYPAMAIGVQTALGYVKPGYVANLVIFNDDLQVTGSIDRGDMQLYQNLEP